MGSDFVLLLLELCFGDCDIVHASVRFSSDFRVDVAFTFAFGFADL